MNSLKNPFNALSKREVEIVKLITQEFSNNDIAERLEISKRTVETHRKNIFRKTKVKSVIGLVVLALKSKVITVD
ncbi:MAG: response regulator transcription factor [Pedobacter sp.]|nr:MAG: response regulator transcription factor [Pedobacter sp.]